MAFDLDKELGLVEFVPDKRKGKAAFEKALANWTRSLNRWFKMKTTRAEVRAAYRDKSGVIVSDSNAENKNYGWLRKNGAWSVPLRWEERGDLGNVIEILRGDGVTSYLEVYDPLERRNEHMTKAWDKKELKKMGGSKGPPPKRSSKKWLARKSKSR